MGPSGIGMTQEAIRAATRAFLWTRLAILAVAVFAALSAGLPDDTRNSARFDRPSLTAPLGGALDLVASPLARWDAVWYLTIANHGYGLADSPRHAFFPLYPLLARGLGQLGGGGPAAVLLAAYAVALLAFLAALALLYRLTELELGKAAAWPTLLLISVFPASLYFGAPYSESLFLLSSVGAFYAARTNHWALAGIAAAAASATRSAGILLVVPLGVIYLHARAEMRCSSRDARCRLSEGHRISALQPAWLALAPLGAAAFAAYLGIKYGDPLSFTHVQDFWNRSFAGPFVAIWDGTAAAFQGLRQLLSGSRDTVYFTASAGDPFRVAAHNLILFGFLAFAVVATVGVLRRLPFAYGLYVVLALALPLSYPVDPQPLMSLPRFVAVLFPIFMWLGVVCAERRLTERVAVVSAILLGVFVTQFATWQWVA